MYQPPAFAIEDPNAVVEAVRRAGFGHLVTTSHTAAPDAVPESASGSEARAAPSLEATSLPFLIDDDLTVVRAHVARANRHWRSMEGAEALLIVPGVDAYISPRWYPSKAEDPKVVPTWNYELVHLRGSLRVIDDPAAKLDIVTALTDHHEAATVEPGTTPWAVDDAPEDFIERQLRAIVGLELTVTTVEAKRKLSQNRSESDQAGVVTGLSASTDARAGSTGEVMARLRDPGGASGGS